MVTGALWTWFKNYLTNRYQINNCFSDLLTVVSGVLQGSILDLYINDVIIYLSGSNPKVC